MEPAPRQEVTRFDVVLAEHLRRSLEVHRSLLELAQREAGQLARPGHAKAVPWRREETPGLRLDSIGCGSVDRLRVDLEPQQLRA